MATTYVTTCKYCNHKFQSDAVPTSYPKCECNPYTGIHPAEIKQEKAMGVDMAQEGKDTTVTTSFIICALCKCRFSVIDGFVTSCPQCKQKHCTPEKKPESQPSPIVAELDENGKYVHTCEKCKTPYYYKEPTAWGCFVNGCCTPNEKPTQLRCQQCECDLFTSCLKVAGNIYRYCPKCGRNDAKPATSEKVEEKKEPKKKPIPEELRKINFWKEKEVEYEKRKKDFPLCSKCSKECHHTNLKEGLCFDCRHYRVEAEPEKKIENPVEYRFKCSKCDKTLKASEAYPNPSGFYCKDCLGTPTKEPEKKMVEMKQEKVFLVCTICGCELVKQLSNGNPFDSYYCPKCIGKAMEEKKTETETRWVTASCCQCRNRYRAVTDGITKTPSECPSCGNTYWFDVNDPSFSTPFDPTKRCLKCNQYACVCKKEPEMIHCPVCYYLKQSSSACPCCEQLSKQKTEIDRVNKGRSMAPAILMVSIWGTAAVSLIYAAISYHLGIK